MYPVEVHNLHKSYGRLKVLRGLSLRVQRGEIYGVLGQNGSGKSTLIHLLMGFLKPSSGTLSVLGTENPEEVRGQVGYLPEQQRYHLRYSAREYLYFLGKMNDESSEQLHARINAELARAGLSEVADRKMTTYSKGMVQRIGIAQAILSNPPLLLMDEPGGGLDLVSRHEMFNTLLNERAHGRTMLLCTHHIDVVENVCDRVGILVGGRVAVELDVHQMRGISTSVNIQVSHLAPPLQEKLRTLSSAVHCGNHIITLRPNTPALQEAVLRTLLDAGVALVALEPLERPLEHVYLEAVRSTSLGLQSVPLSGPIEPASTRTDQPAYPDQSTSARQTTTEEREKAADTLLRELLKKNKSPLPAQPQTSQQQASLSGKKEHGEGAGQHEETENRQQQNSSAQRDIPGGTSDRPE